MVHRKHRKWGRNNSCQKLKENVVDIKRLGHRIMGVELVLGKVILNILSEYVPRGGLEEHTEKNFGKIWMQLYKEY